MQDLGHPARGSAERVGAAGCAPIPQSCHAAHLSAALLPAEPALRRPDRPIHDASSSTTGFDKANAPACSLGSEAYGTCDARRGASMSVKYSCVMDTPAKFQHQALLWALDACMPWRAGAGGILVVHAVEGTSQKQIDLLRSFGVQVPNRVALQQRAPIPQQA